MLKIKGVMLESMPFTVHNLSNLVQIATSFSYLNVIFLLFLESSW
jgi:hypothetical protein